MSESTSRGTARLRMLLASIIADHFKAYELPPLGQRLGLAPGTDSEAMSSKRLYVTKRLQSLQDHEVRRIAGELARDVQNDELDALLVESSPGDAGISSALIRFDREVVHRRWTDALERRATDPEGAITLARTLLEDVIKWLLSKQGIGYDDKADLPVLYRLIANALKLAPDAYTEDVFKRILGSCQSVVESLGTLRNRLSDAHSEGPLRAKPHGRHAELAVNLAGTMATFLVSTWEHSMTDTQARR
ncbi:hypothetical protein ABIB58_003097 [Brevundimonas sp. UYEF29]|uniref:abortive infection family protein n=1 Tax=unclassified Brevundimonas TaxID=2622653 RepID=UPI002236A29A|nr:abortive infection family protein [Brevundimonas sp. BT-123]MCW0047308.1 abortive infection family protein [Brevundimonas sp. BT-123]